MTIPFGMNQTHSAEAAGFPWEGRSPGETMGIPELQCSPGFPGAAQQGEGQCCGVGAVASLRVLRWRLLAPAGICSVHLALSSALLLKGKVGQ